MTWDLREFVCVIDDALPPAMCDDIVRQFDSTVSHASRVQVDGQLSFDELEIDGRPEWITHQVALERAKDHFYRVYQARCPGRFPATHGFESFRIKRYRPEAKDEFRNHVDGYDLVSSRRFLVCFWYLNDVETGGQTTFPELGLEVQPRRGRLIMFPPFWMFEHAGLPPVSNPKYIISTYLLFDHKSQ